MNKYHNFDHETIENLIPFERDLYQDMIIDDVQKSEAAALKQEGVTHAFTEAGDKLKGY